MDEPKTFNFGECLHPETAIERVYRKYKPADMVFLANTKIIRELSKEMIALTLYEMWEAIKEEVENG